MSLSGATAPPIGHVEFCERHQGECGAYDKPNQVVRLTPAVWDGLDIMNRAINRAVLPATDMEIFGTLERWDYPALAGDCEDYALEKRRMLTDAGWPASSLLITVVRDEIGEGHAVLTVRTDRGDLILDNKTDEIVLWDAAPYQFVKRQSARHAAAWDGIEDGRTAAVGSLR
ncbi:MAG TPA: transglutaminase-like cysteine peptidase [Methylomirabilota bacterium]|nr:transglutaminase-like cysteine peptidase [Methylomirabilota bacterium]